jgi:hypothetical protein
MALLVDEHRRRYRYRLSRRTFRGLRGSGRTVPEYTAASGRLDHATYRERADASVRCTGLKTCLLWPTVSFVRFNTQNNKTEPRAPVE